jgi:hypothetical protein
MSSKPVVIKLACDLKEAQTNHVRSKLSEILKVYFENMFPEYYPNNRNIGPFKYRFQLSIFQFSYSIDNIDYQLSHGLRLHKSLKQFVYICYCVQLNGQGYVALTTAQLAVDVSTNM